MRNLGFYNGKIGDPDKMTVPFNDRVCFFGDGIYDATYCHSYNIHALDDHLERFYNNLHLVGINLPIEKPELAKLLTELAKQVSFSEQFIYWQATRGTQLRNHTYNTQLVGNLWVVIKEGRLKDLSRPLHCRTVEDTRFYHCNIKTLNLMPNVLHAQETEKMGLDETIFHRGNRVTECAHSNVSMLKNGEFITPPTDNLILPGIARSRLIKMCQKLGIPVKEQPFTLNELFCADEIIVSSAGSLCLSVSELDGKRVGGQAKLLLNTLQSAILNEFLEETECHVR